MLSLTILALFTSTTTYLVVTIIFYQAYFLQAFLWAGYELWFQGIDVRGFTDQSPIFLLKSSQSWPPFCARTVTFTINVCPPPLARVLVLTRTPSLAHAVFNLIR